MKILEVMKNVFYAIGGWIKRLLPNPKDSDESKNFKKTLYLLIAGMLFMVLVAVITFLAYIQPLDETVIPVLVGEDFRDAINALQTKKLVPVMDFQFTNMPEDRDKVMEQTPKPREKVRIGSRVNLVVSKGITYDQLGNYINRTLSEVENLLKTFNKERELIRIRQPINYVTNKAAPGTIIAQNPPPGTDLSDKVLFLELTVSKGQARTSIEIGDYTGKDFQTVISELQAANITFIFVVNKTASDGTAGTITGQNIEAGTKIDPTGLLRLEMNAPAAVPEGRVFGVFTYPVPDFGTPVLIKVESSVLGRRETLLSQERFGGRLTLPYILDEDAEIILTIAGEEKKPEKVRAF